MKDRPKVLCAVVLCMLFVGVPSLWAQWITDGVPVCTATGNQYDPELISDGSGGAIITWCDDRAGNYDIYAQRVSASGVAQWTAGGVAVCTATGVQALPQLISDGAGGAIITWFDDRAATRDIYAQRVNASGVAQWTANGVAVCTAAGYQERPQITSDGNGGAIITWFDDRAGNYDIYAQRVNASGAVQWTADGVAVCTATGTQEYPQITSDGSGGAIITWDDFRAGNWDIYAQRVSASGAAQWTANGVAVCTATGSQYGPKLTSDGSGGAIITWCDYRAGNADIYAQRVSASGAVQWTADGVPVCTATGNQHYPQLISDGSGGAIITWCDYRAGNWDVYAQLIDRFGQIGGTLPVIYSVRDVPGDQGGWVRITIWRSRLDDELESTYRASTYNVWQRIDDPSFLALATAEGGGYGFAALKDEEQQGRTALAASASGWPVRELGGRMYLDTRDLLGAELPPGAWELVGSFAACQQEEYIYRASTLADSTAAGIPYAVYFVSVHTTTPAVWFVSLPDSGYSVDNLPPGTPQGFAAEQSFEPAGLSLAWEINAERDLSHYAVYRGLSEDFVPAEENRIAAPLEPELFDADWRWDGGYFYKLSALDVNGNESGWALLRPEEVTGTDGPGTPLASYLAQNYPNPFNPSTTIAFALAGPGRVSLRVYDAAGRLVRVLVDEPRAAGRYEEAWDGTDEAGRAVASGVYFYRLEAGAYTETRKMVLVR